jgi:hypothetical protein
VKNIQIEDLFVVKNEHKEIFNFDIKDIPPQFIQHLEDALKQFIPDINEEAINQNKVVLGKDLAQRGIRRIGRNEGTKLIQEARERFHEEHKGPEGNAQLDGKDKDRGDFWGKRAMKKLSQPKREEIAPAAPVVVQQLIPREEMSQRLQNIFEESFDRALKNKATELGFPNYQISPNPDIEYYKTALRQDMRLAIMQSRVDFDRMAQNWGKIIENMAGIIQPLLKASSLGDNYISMDAPGEKGKYFDTFQEAWHAGLQGKDVGQGEKGLIRL